MPAPRKGADATASKFDSMNRASKASTHATLRRRACIARACTRMFTPLCHFVAAGAVLLVVAVLPSPAAAQSFSYESSAAVADFDADGRPDVAVSNHIGQSGAAYRIEFQLSNGGRESFSFASVEFALNVAAVDVDNDHDLDLVVTALLSRDVVGVWLNDGQGHFRPGDPDAFPSDLAALSTGTMTGCPPQFAVAAPTPRRFAASPSSTLTIAFVAVVTHVRPPAIDTSNCFLLSCLSPRAPPSHV